MHTDTIAQCVHMCMQLPYREIDILLLFFQVDFQTRLKINLLYMYIGMIVMKANSRRRPINGPRERPTPTFQEGPPLTSHTVWTLNYRYYKITLVQTSGILSASGRAFYRRIPARWHLEDAIIRYNDISRSLRKIWYLQ